MFPLVVFVSVLPDFGINKHNWLRLEVRMSAPNEPDKYFFRHNCLISVALSCQHRSSPKKKQCEWNEKHCSSDGQAAVVAEHKVTLSTT